MSFSLPVLSSQKVIRPICSYAPDFWGDQFHNYEPESLEKQEKEVGKLKEEVRTMLSGSTKDLFHQLKLIDDIQRLGVAYHFEGEIEEALENIYATYFDCDFKKIYMDLNHFSLCFRLLRQQGINISSEIFNTFKDENGMFKESLVADVEGLLSLYEAAFLGVRGETALDEALIFSTTHLEASLKHGSDTFSKMVSKALHRPLRKSLVRLNAAHFISIYKDCPSYNETLLRFAILDFNYLQSMHKKELSDTRKWWIDIEFGKKFPFARDRMVEIFFWITSMAFEPQFCLVRRIVTKFLYLLSIVDDIYDSYGTFEELSHFTPTLKRWSRESMNDLPEYMKICHQLVLDCVEEIEESMIKQNTLYRMFYVKEVVNKQVQSYFEEAKWSNEKYIPRMEEYLYVSLMSCAYAFISTLCFVGMGVDAATVEDFQWLSKGPKILKATEVIARLMDDIVSYKREKETGQVATAIECYKTQYGMTEEEAIQVLRNWVSEAWKDINQEFLKPTAVKINLLSRLLYMAQIMDESYKEEDSYTLIGKSMRDGISTLFINPLPL